MEPIEVTARFEPEGKIVPLSFTWQGQTYPVDSTGRHWEDQAGLHTLVMVPGERVYELIFIRAESRWYLRRPGPDRRMV